MTIESRIARLERLPDPPADPACDAVADSSGKLDWDILSDGERAFLKSIEHKCDWRAPDLTVLSVDELRQLRNIRNKLTRELRDRVVSILDDPATPLETRSRITNLMAQGSVDGQIGDQEPAKVEAADTPLFLGPSSD